MSDTIIKVENLSKKYKGAERSSKTYSSKNVTDLSIKKVSLFDINEIKTYSF